MKKKNTENEFNIFLPSISKFKSNFYRKYNKKNNANSTENVIFVEENDKKRNENCCSFLFSPFFLSNEIKGKIMISTK